MHVNSQAISFSSQQEISARQLFLLQKQCRASRTFLEEEVAAKRMIYWEN